ncbi:hypothetical protein TorRG33x02_301610, partial [Trema orientale]
MGLFPLSKPRIGDLWTVLVVSWSEIRSRQFASTKPPTLSDPSILRAAISPDKLINEIQ